MSEKIEHCGNCGRPAGPKNLFCRSCGYVIGDRIHSVRLNAGMGRHSMNPNVQEFLATGDPSKV